LGNVISLYFNREDRLIPHYNYQCSNCKHEFELFQKMSDSVKKKCPKCKKLKLIRLIGAGSGIIFKKGVGGFYCKDYSTDVKQESKIDNPKVKKGPAKKAAEAKNEVDVRKCITNKSQAQERLNNLKKIVAQDEDMLSKMKSQWQARNNKVSQAESNHAQLAVRKQMAEARKEFAKSSQGLDSDSCFSELDKLQQSVEEDECEAEAFEEMTPVDDLEDMASKYRANSDASVDDEVAKLMGK